MAFLSEAHEAPDEPAKPSRTRILRRVLLGVAATSLVAAAVLLAPPVQRRLALAFFPSGPETSLELAHVRVGPRAVHLRGVRLLWHGLRVSFDEADLEVRPWALLGRTALVKGVRVKGLVVDARGAAPGETAPKAPFEFHGLAPLARLPIRGVVKRLDVDARLFLPGSGPGTGARVDVTLEGRDLAPGRTAKLNANVAAALLTAGGEHPVLVGRGSLRAHETDDARLDQLEFEGDVRPPETAHAGAGLAAQVTLDLTKREERYHATLATAGAATRDVLRIAAVYDGAARVSGEWSAQLDRGQVEPYLRGFVPPAFAVTGNGTFALETKTAELALAGSFDAGAARWEVLHPSLGRLGALRIRGRTDLRLAGPVVSFAGLSLDVSPEGRDPVAEVGSDQPFTVKLDDVRTITAARPAEPVVHARLASFPLAWLGLPEGTIGGSCSVAVDPDRIQASLKDAVVALATGDTLRFAGEASMRRAGPRVVSLQGKLEARIPRVNAREKSIDRFSAEGRLELDAEHALLRVHSASVGVNGAAREVLLSGVVETRRPLEVSLRDGSVGWNTFQPELLRLRLGGFPVSWVSRFLPQARVSSGRLYGELRAVKVSDAEVRIECPEPLELRGADILVGDVPIVRGAKLTLTPAFRLTPDAAEIDVSGISYRDESGGRFTGDVHLKARPERGSPVTFTASLSAAAPTLTGRYGRIGTARLHAEGRFEPATRRLDVTSAAFDVHDALDRRFLAGKTVAPFAVELDPFRVRAARAGETLFEAEFVPLELEKVFPSAFGFSLSGNLPSGRATVNEEDGGLLLRTAAPLEFGPVRLSRNGVDLLEDVVLSFSPELFYTPRGVGSRTTRIAISAKGRSLATVVLSGRFDVTGDAPQRYAETRVRGVLPPRLGFRAGEIAVDSRTTLLPSRSNSFHLAITGAVARDGTRIPDLAVDAEARRESDDTSVFRVPIAITSGGRVSDLLVTGRLRRGAEAAELDGEITSRRLVASDVASLALGLASEEIRASASSPRGAEPPPASFSTIVAPAPDVPVWQAVKGRLAVKLASIEVDRYTVSDAAATLEANGRELSARGIAASLLGASLRGDVALRFDAKGRAPYAADVDLDVASIDLGRLFTTVRPDSPATLDGTYRAFLTARGSGGDPASALRAAHATFTLDGQGGTFRALRKGVRKLSYLTRAAGVLTFSKEIRAAGRAIGTLEALPIERAGIRLERVPGEGLHLRELEIRTPELVGRLTGTLEKRDVPFVDRPLTAELSLAAKGDVSVLFAGMKMLGEKPDAAGYLPVTRTFKVSGTAADPDTSDLWLALDEAGKNAKGAFGAGLRKAKKVMDAR